MNMNDSVIWKRKSQEQFHRVVKIKEGFEPRNQTYRFYYVRIVQLNMSLNLVSIARKSKSLTLRTKLLFVGGTSRPQLFPQKMCGCWKKMVQEVISSSLKNALQRWGGWGHLAQPSYLRKLTYTFTYQVSVYKVEPALLLCPPDL